MQTVTYTGALLGDLYTPAGSGLVPGVVCAMGDGWRGGHRQSWDADASRLSIGGKLAMSVDYSLAPPGGTAHFDAPVLDLIAAVEYLRTQPRCNGKVGIIGSSAGGHLATMVAIRGGADCAVSWSGPVNLHLGHHTAPGGPIAFDQEENFLDSTDHTEAIWNDASPLIAAASCVPIWFANSSNEVIPVEGARAWDLELNTIQPDHHYREIPGTAHARQYARQVWADSEAWLTSHLV